MLEEDGIGEPRTVLGFVIQQQRLVVPMLTLPAPDRLRCHMLGAELQPCHIVGRVDDEEQRKGQQVYPDQDRDGIQQAA